MLLNLHVKNLAIIDEFEVDFTEHLNILTGETGAGKSIIIGSINIALGGKVSPDFIRKGAQFGFVELVFQIKEKELLQKIESLDIPIEDNLLVLSRKIMKNRSICKVNDETVTTATMKIIANSLIDLHGQHEHQSLLYKKKHLDILDRFSKEFYGTAKETLKTAFEEYEALKKEIKRIEMPEEDRLRERSFLEYQIQEIETAHLKEGEEKELEFRFRKLLNAGEIADGLGSVYHITGEESNSVSDQISRAERILNKLEDYDNPIKNLRFQLTEIDNLLNDFNRELVEYRASVDYDNSELSDVESRLNHIHNLKAKFGNTVEEVMEYYEKSLEKVKQYEFYDNYMETLMQQKKNAEDKLIEQSNKVSSIRKKCAESLKIKIHRALIDLNFLDVQFDITFQQLHQYTAYGFDEIEFLISTNPGEDLKPLGKVASGGELSRIMLAIKSVLAEQDSIDTLIFDEIDVGISGRTAQKVSEKLAMIAKKHQIISITHLPQIASMADSHYMIEKQTDGVETRTKIRFLNYEESVEELARMLSGAKITDTVLRNAKEMKELAATSKKY